MRLKYLPEALADLDAAAAWYESRQEGLGDSFLTAVERVVRRLLAFPHSGRRLVGEYRYARILGFPYGMVYRLESDSLVIRAVWHAEQNPESLRGRLDSSGP